MTQNSLPFVDVMPSGDYDAVVIWLHGLGDSGHGFAPIVPALNLPDSHRIRFIFPHAPIRLITINNGMKMHAWYDIKSLDFESRADVEGVRESAAQVRTLVEQELAKGIPSDRIVLAGFSQGGVIAYQLGLRYDKPLAGIMALSTYLSDTSTLAEQVSDSNKSTPVFVAHGQNDDVVPVSMGKAAYRVLEELKLNATWREYPMQHNVCEQELADISQWLQTLLLK